MRNRHSAATAALPSLTVVPAALQQACATIEEELGPYVPVIDSVWKPFARACGVQVGATDGLRPFFVGPDHAWLTRELAVFSHERPASDEVPAGNSARESPAAFGVIVPTTAAHSAMPTDPTLQLWQSGYTPVTVHRVPVDTGDGVIEVVAATVRPRPNGANSAFDDAD